MPESEQAVIEAARKCFGRTVDDETGQEWLNGSICTWQVAALADAVRRLDGYPPYGDRRVSAHELDRIRRVHQGYAEWKRQRSA